MAVTVDVRDQNWTCIAAVSTENGCAHEGACQLGAVCGDRARGTIPDLKKGDYLPPRSPPESFAGFSQSTQSNSELEQELRSSLSSFGAGGLGTGMVNRFMSGSGLRWIHGPGSWLSRMAVQHPNFISFKDDALRLIWAGLEREGVDPSRRRYTFYFVSHDFGWVGFEDFAGSLYYRATGRGQFNPIRTCIGGTKGFKIFISNLEVHDSQRASAHLRFEICDHFGVGNDDFYYAGLRAFWFLQHARPGPQRPFCNLIVIEERYDLTPEVR